MANGGRLNACSFKIYDMVDRKPPMIISFESTTESYWKLVLKSAPVSDSKVWLNSLVVENLKEDYDLNIIAEDLGFMTMIIELRRTELPEWNSSLTHFQSLIDKVSIRPSLGTKQLCDTLEHIGQHTVLGWYRNEIDDPTRGILLVIPTGKEYESTACYASHRLTASVSFMAIADTM